jgi:RNA polymerase sigma-70 factor (ECF subfamily)
MAAFEALLRRHFHSAFLVAMSQLEEPSDAEDACQDAFVRCWERLGECREPSKFRSWLLRTVRNTAHNHREYLEVRAGPPVDSLADLAAPSDPAGDLDRKERARVLRSALGTLDIMPYEVIVMHDLEGWKHAEIAAKLGISELMARQYLSAARKALRQRLAHEPHREESSE